MRVRVLVLALERGRGPLRRLPCLLGGVRELRDLMSAASGREVIAPPCVYSAIPSVPPPATCASAGLAHEPRASPRVGTIWFRAAAHGRPGAPLHLILSAILYLICEACEATRAHNVCQLRCQSVSVCRAGSCCQRRTCGATYCLVSREKSP